MFIAGIVHNHIFQGLKKLSERENDKRVTQYRQRLVNWKDNDSKNSKDLYIRRYGLTKKQKIYWDNLM